jgi:hypothetical protein
MMGCSTAVEKKLTGEILIAPLSPKESHNEPRRPVPRSPWWREEIRGQNRGRSPQRTQGRMAEGEETGASKCNNSTEGRNYAMIRLQNGTHVRPDKITAIRVLPTERGSLGDLHRARVCVHHSGYVELLLANDGEHAVKIADEIAEMVKRSSGLPSAPGTAALPGASR